MWQGWNLSGLGLKHFDLLIDRRGELTDSFLTTKSVLCEVKNNSFYRICPGAANGEGVPLVEIDRSEVSAGEHKEVPKWL